MDQSSIHIDESALLRSYPQLKQVPKDHLQIIVLSIAGMGPAAVADTMGVTRQTVWNVMQRYNVKEIIGDVISLQRMLLANSLGSMAVDALAALTQKRDDLKNMTARSLLEFITQCVELSDAIRPKEKIAKKSTDELLEELKQDG